MPSEEEFDRTAPKVPTADEWQRQHTKPRKKKRRK